MGTTFIKNRLSKQRKHRAIMEAVNVIKGYNKVNTHHENPSSPPQKRLKAAVIIAAVVLLTLTVGLVISGLNIDESKESPTSLSSNSNESIKTVCKVTRYPDLCFTSISSSLNVSTTKNPDPEFIFRLSLQVSINELFSISSSIKNLDDHSHSAHAALVDCMGQLEDALSRLKDSLSEMEVGSGGEKMLTERKVNDIQTWISAAMTDEDSCLDGLLEMESTVADEFKIKTEKSRKLLSNNLAIIANIQALLRKFGLRMH